MEDERQDDRQIYLTEDTWNVLEKLEEFGFCKSSERYRLARVAVSIALARGLEAGSEEMKSRQARYQRDLMEPLVDVVKWRYPAEQRPYWRISNLAHAGCAFIRQNAQEFEGNTPFVEIVTEDFDSQIESWVHLDDHQTKR